MYGLDLFSGIGGITKALEGYVTPVAYCENDRYAQAVLLSRMGDGRLPEAPIWDDVQTLRGSMFPDNLIEIIYGGFPCQDISYAGRRAGLEGKRSGLFFEVVRLAGEIQPPFIFLENVRGIITSGIGVVAGEMVRLGYDSRWGILSASDVGAPHRRDRWWLLAHRMQSGGSSKPRKQQAQWPTLINPSGQRELADAQGVGVERMRAQRFKESEVHAEKEISMRDCSRIRNSTSTGLPNRTALTMGKQGKKSQSERSNWWSVEPNVGRVAHGVPFRVDRLRGLGNAVVPAQAREAFERLMGLK